MNVINVVLEGAEKEIALTGGTHARIENRGDSTIYVSKHSGITPESNGVMAIDGGNTNILTDVATTDIKDGVVDYYGAIYALGTGKVQIVTTNSQNFRSTGKGGDISNCYTKPEVDTLLSAKANSAHTHVISDTTGLQSALNGKANSTHTHAISDIANLQSTLDGKANKIGGSKRYYVGRLTDTSTYYKVFTISCADFQTVYADFSIHGIEHAMVIRGEVSLRYTSNTNVDMYATIYSSVFSASACDLYYKKVSAGEYDVYIKPAGWIGAIDCYIDNAVAIQNTSLSAYTTWDGLNRISTATTGVTTTDATGMTTVSKGV